MMRTTLLFLTLPFVLNGAMNFTDVTAEAKILHTHAQSSIGNFWTNYQAHMTAGAVAEDFDGDGWIDLYVLKGDDGPNLLYINQRDGTFSDEAVGRGVALVGAHIGVCAADYDADGDIDIFISVATAPHLLLTNEGDGSFTIDSQEFLLPALGTTSPSWADIDNDGLLDLALGAWRPIREERPDTDLQIYRNLGNGRLSPYLTLAHAWDFVPRFIDFDSDGFQDLVAVADFGQTVMYRNSGDGLFLQSDTSDVEHGMGVATGDVDNDGDLDVFMTSIRDYNPGAKPG